MSKREDELTGPVSIPEFAVALAHDRTSSIVKTWRLQQSGDLGILARSAYLQGIKDALECIGGPRLLANSIFADTH